MITNKHFMKTFTIRNHEFHKTLVDHPYKKYMYDIANVLHTCNHIESIFLKKMYTKREHEHG